jgi:hypothetical protein
MKKFILSYLPFYALFIFFISNILAMIFYPGGTIQDSESIGYDFFRNFLSQLGRTKAYLIDDYGNQLSNLISFRIWSSGMAVTGILFLIYYFHLPSFFKKKAAILGSFLAIISSICFIGTGITPLDVIVHLSDRQGNILNTISMFEIHVFFANNIFYFAFPSALIYSYIIYNSKKINKMYGTGYYLFSFSLLIYIFILKFGPSPIDGAGEIIQATSIGLGPNFNINIYMSKENENK